MQSSSKPTSRNALRTALRTSATFAAAALTLTILARPTEDAVANGDTRTISMIHAHTGESIQVTYKRDGRFDADALKKLNWFLRDWRRNEPTRMDPRVIDTLWLAYRDVGATQPITVVCGYRAPETNAMLRRRSRGVAKFSQHTLGKAIDFFIPGVNLTKLRVAGLRLQRGGVGFYPTSGSPFVHMDSGSVRMWPRMTRAQLASVFPDGRTVHVPSDGKPLAGYKLAFADVMRNGGSVGGFQGRGDDDSDGAASTGSGFSLFAGLSRNSAPQAASAKPGTVQALFASNTPRSVQTPAPIAQPKVKVPTPAPAVEPEPAPAKPAPVVVAKADVPIPARRPSELDGPQMAWQTGPTAATPASDAAATVASAEAVPLPPLRPETVDPEPQQASMQLAALSAEASQESAPPIPVHKPAVLEPTAPLQADLGIGSLIRRQITPPSQALGFADASAPLPVASAPQPLLIATRFENLDFATVVTPVASTHDAVQAGLVRPDLGSIATLIPVPPKMVVMRFGVAAYQDLRVERFSGTAIRPLRTASFTVPSEIITGSL